MGGRLFRKVENCPRCANRHPRTYWNPPECCGITTMSGKIHRGRSICFLSPDHTTLASPSTEPTWRPRSRRSHRRQRRLRQDNRVHFFGTGKQTLQEIDGGERCSRRSHPDRGHRVEHRRERDTHARTALGSRCTPPYSHHRHEAIYEAACVRHRGETMAGSLLGRRGPRRRLRHLSDERYRPAPDDRVHGGRSSASPALRGARFQIPQDIPEKVWHAYHRLVELGFDAQVIR